MNPKLSHYLPIRSSPEEKDDAFELDESSDTVHAPLLGESRHPFAEHIPPTSHTSSYSTIALTLILFVNLIIFGFGIHATQELETIMTSMRPGFAQADVDSLEKPDPYIGLPPLKSQADHNVVRAASNVGAAN